MGCGLLSALEDDGQQVGFRQRKILCSGRLLRGLVAVVCRHCSPTSTESWTLLRISCGNWCANRRTQL